MARPLPRSARAPLNLVELGDRLGFYAAESENVPGTWTWLHDLKDRLGDDDGGNPARNLRQLRSRLRRRLAEKVGAALADMLVPPLKGRRPYRYPAGRIELRGFVSLMKMCGAT